LITVWSMRASVSTSALRGLLTTSGRLVPDVSTRGQLASATSGPAETGAPSVTRASTTLPSRSSTGGSSLAANRPTDRPPCMVLRHRDTSAGRAPERRP